MSPRLAIPLAIALAVAGAGCGAWLAMRRAAPGTAPPIQTVGTFDAADPQLGRKAYVFCIGCHGDDGLGRPGYAPALAGSAWLAGDPRLPILMVLHGFDAGSESGSAYVSARMLAHGRQMSDSEIAALLTWARARWARDATPVDAGLVARLRARHHDRTRPWTPAELRALPVEAP